MRGRAARCLWVNEEPTPSSCRDPFLLTVYMQPGDGADCRCYKPRPGVKIERAKRKCGHDDVEYSLGGRCLPCIDDRLSERASLIVFVEDYLRWALSPEHCDGELFHVMLESYDNNVNYIIEAIEK